MSDAGIDDKAGKEAVPEGTVGLILRFIKPHSAVEHRVEVDFTTSIRTLKEEMESEINVPADQQEWRYNDLVLADESALGDSVRKADAIVEVRKL